MSSPQRTQEVPAGRPGRAGGASPDAARCIAPSRIALFVYAEAAFARISSGDFPIALCGEGNDRAGVVDPLPEDKASRRPLGDVFRSPSRLVAQSAPTAVIEIMMRHVVARQPAGLLVPEAPSLAGREAVDSRSFYPSGAIRRPRNVDGRAHRSSTPEIAHVEPTSPWPPARSPSCRSSSAFVARPIPPQPTVSATQG